MIKSFGDKAGARGLLGQDGWLFLCGDSNDVVGQLTGGQVIHPSKLGRYKDSFARRADFFAKKRIPYFFFVAPTKELVYRDKLPYGYDIDMASFPATRVLESIRDSGVQSHYLLEDVIGGRADYPEVFLRTDTHWNLYGAYAAYVAMHRRISSAVQLTRAVRLDDLQVGQVQGYRGDLADKQKAVLLPGHDAKLLEIAEGSLPPEQFSETAPRLSGRPKYVTAPVADHLMVSATRDTIVHEMVDRELPKAVVFRDSFGISLIPYLSTHFSRIVYVWKPDVLFDVIDKEAPDVVLNVNLDRFLRLAPEH